MAFLFGFLFFVALIILLVGLIKPELVIKWGEKKGRKEVLKYYGAATLVFLILSSCLDSSTPISSEDAKYPYHFVDSKTEKSGDWKNTMDLYYCSEPIDVKQLQEFCKYKKNTTKSKAFYFVVIFNNEKNAAFPKSPFNGQYGDEPEVLEHIRAYYVYNTLNGFSELQYYQKGKSGTFKI